MGSFSAHWMKRSVCKTVIWIRLDGNLHEFSLKPDYLKETFGELLSYAIQLRSRSCWLVGLTFSV